MTKNTQAGYAKKLLLVILGLSIVVAVSLVILVSFLFRHDTSDEPFGGLDYVEIDELDISPEEQEAIESTEIISGIVGSVSEEGVSVAFEEGDGILFFFAFTDATLYQKGVDYIDGLRDEITEGEKVDLTIDTRTNEIIAIWYDQEN